MIKEDLSDVAVKAKQYLHIDSPYQKEYFSDRLIILQTWLLGDFIWLQKLILSSKARQFPPKMILKACITGFEYNTEGAAKCFER